MHSAEAQAAIRALLDASSVLLSSHNLPELLQRILDIAQRTLAADAYAVWRADSAPPCWRIAASRGLSENYVRQTLLDTSNRSLDEPLLLDDLRSDPRLDERMEQLIREGIRAMAVVPIAIGGSKTATIVFYYRSSRSFTPEDLDYARTVANLAGAAIDNAELFRKQQAAAERADLAATITSIFNSSLDFESTAQAVANAVVPFLADWCSLSLYLDGSMQRIAVAHQNPEKIALALEMIEKYPENLTPERGALHVMLTRQPELITGITDESLTAAARSDEHLSLMRALQIRSLITVPLTLPDRAIGILRLISSESRPELTPDDVQFAVEIAARAASAIENARLHREQRSIAERMRKLNETAQREREFLSLAQRVAKIGSWELDLTAHPVKALWSPDLQQMYGLAPGQFDGLLDSWVQAIHPEDREAVTASLQQAIASDGQWEQEFRITLPDGSIRWIAARGQCFPDAAGEPATMIGINMDVTERRATEAVLLRSEKLSAAGRLAATIAHEINNPLEAVTNLVYLARRSAPEEAAALLDTADQELSRMAHITRQTLGFYKESAAAKEFNLAQTAQQVLALLRPYLTRRGIRTEARLRPVLLLGVEGEVRQVISNLLTNAVDASPSNSTIRIHVGRGFLRRGDALCPAARVTIGDAGQGIPAAMLPRIFEPFFTTKKDVGTGLGLWVSREIVLKHRGRLALRSQPARGSAFSILLPTQSDGI